MPAVATPASAPASGNLSRIMLASSLFTKSRICGCDKTLRLSQYTGDSQPDAQAYGCCGLRWSALICSSFSAKDFALLVMCQTYAKAKHSMLFAQKIYIANKPLILTNDAASYIKEHPIAGGYAQYLGAFPRHYRLAFQHLSRPRALGALIQDISPDALKAEMHHLYAPIDAAGGVVRNEQG